MIKRSRKVLAMIVVAALVVANAVAPRLSHAAMHPQAVLQAAAATHDHHHDQPTRQAAEALPCEDHGTADHAGFQPEHNCCLAACAPIAFIFAVFDVARPQPAEDFDWPLTRILRASAATAIDPPPRKV
jgi:hypothetical protein